MQRTISGYVLIEQVGSTGLATVYRAEQPLRRREVALKMLRPYMCADEAFMEEFSREMERVVRLDHPNILPAYSVEAEGPLHWITMQYVPWPTLRQWLQHPIPAAMAMAILKQVAGAVEAAHREGVSHGDIKPGNIFLDPETGQVLLSDFGMSLLAKGAPPAVRTALKTPLPTYTAPERARGSPPNIQSDTYSLGVLLYDMLTGTVPFNALDPATVLTRQLTSSPTAPSRVNPDVPQELDAPILKALAPHPERRYETPEELIRALEEKVPAATLPMPFAALGKADVPWSFPGTKREEEKALPPREEGPETICTVCGQSNPAGATWCSACWGSLSRVAAAPGAGVATAEKRRQRWRRATRIRRALLASAVVIIGAYIAVQVLDITPPLATPSSAISSESGPGEWAMANRNLSGPGPVPGESAALQNQTRWTFKASGPVVSTPAVKGDRVYLTTYDGLVVALDRATGNPVWEYRGSGTISSSPAVAGDLLFYGGRDSNLTALDADTGAWQWEFETQNPIIGSPIVYDGVVYIGSGDGSIYAVDALTGRKQWSHSTKNWIVNTPALMGDILVVGSMDGAVYFYDIDTGKQRFEERRLGRIEGSPIVVGDSAYVATRDGMVYSLNLREKEVPLAKSWYRIRLQLYIWAMAGNPGLPKGMEWVTFLRDSLVATPTADESAIYLSGDSGRIYALDIATGKRLWTFKSESDYLSAPTLVDGLLLATDQEGRLHAVDSNSGEEQWTFQVAGGITSTPVVAGGTLYLAARDGTLYAIE